MDAGVVTRAWGCWEVAGDVDVVVDAAVVAKVQPPPHRQAAARPRQAVQFQDCWRAQGAAFGFPQKATKPRSHRHLIPFWTG